MIGAVVAVLVSISALLYSFWPLTIDPETNCPSTGPTSYTVVLVDLTDPLNAVQQQALRNHFERIRDVVVPVHGSLELYAVEGSGDRLLTSRRTRCRPERITDVSGEKFVRNEKRLERKWHEQYQAPFDETLEQVSLAKTADQSPILEAIQSTAVNSLLKAERLDKPRLLIVISDFIQHTDAISFYRSVPDPTEFVQSSAFRQRRIDLSGTGVLLYQIERENYSHGPELMQLWKAVMQAEGAQACIDTLLNFKSSRELDCTNVLGDTP